MNNDSAQQPRPSPSRTSAISRCLTRLILSSALIVVLNMMFIQHRYFVGYGYDSFNVTKYDASSPDPDRQHQHSNTNIFEVAQCTPDQLSTIQKQLPPDDCLKHQHEPWKQLCSLTYATRCPDAVWLEDYYTELHTTTTRHHHQHDDSANSKQRASPDSPFLGISIGCNKGLDAVNVMRMGSGNPIFDKFAWADAMSDLYIRGRFQGKVKLNQDVCNQATSPQFALPQKSTEEKNGPSPTSQMHCIEPMPVTIRALQRSAYKLQYNKMGFIVTHAAMSKEDGSVLFARGTNVGEENSGIGTTKCIRQNCMNVTMYSLDTYISKFVPKGIPINYLSVDVEGYDYDVLLGGNLSRVHYLEFEYNWMGSWKNQSLHHAIDYLDQQFGFTCYWAGFNNTIWRITNCWLDHYDIHFWSNVACVNRNAHEVRQVAEDMEALFLETLEKGEENVRDFEHRFQRKD